VRPTAANKEALQNMCPSVRSALLMMDTFPDLVPSHFLPLGELVEPMAVDRILHLQVYRIIQATGQFIDDISVRYFQGIHRWFPIISRRRFHNHLVNSPASPTADLSILLLSICLITYYPSQTSAQLADQESLYLTARMLFAHVQAFIPASTHLIQAGILISVYEYAHGRRDAAYISIGTCARMAYATGIHKVKPAPGFHDNEACLAAEEERNVWWGIVICERYCSFLTRNHEQFSSHIRYNYHAEIAANAWQNFLL